MLAMQSAATSARFRHLLVTLVCLQSLCAVGCARKGDAGADRGTAAARTDSPGAMPELEATFGAGPAASHYVARFEGTHPITITETRTLPGDGVQRSEYRYRGARLTGYRSDLGDREHTRIEMRFDPDGRLLSAIRRTDTGSEQLTEAQIYAIRDRADLLRNHALARRAVRTHGR